MDPELKVNMESVATADALYVSVETVCEPPPLCTGDPFNVATNVPVPAAAGAVTVAVYVPLPLSVTEPTDPDPDVRVIVTASPPVDRVLPAESLACTVSTCVARPSAAIVAEDGVSVDADALTGPTGTTATAGELATEVPAEFVAVAVYVYDWPLVSDPKVHVKGEPDGVHVAPPLCVTRYEVATPPVVDGVTVMTFCWFDGVPLTVGALGNGVMMALPFPELPESLPLTNVVAVPAK